GEDVTVHGLGRSGDTSFYRPVDPRVHPVVTPLPDIEGEDVEAKVARSIAALGRAVDVAAYDVVHAQDCIAANAVDARCVRTVHHLDAFTTPALVRCHERAVLEPPTLVCVSRQVAQEVQATRGRTATVVPNGVDAARFAAVDPAARARWRERLGGAPLVVTVGGIEPRKGTLDLVEAVALLGPGARLAVGGGETLFDYRDYRAHVDRRVVQLGVDLEVLGPLAEQDVAPVIASADVFAMPSLKEGFGLAALEALAAGVPVVLRDLPVFREVFGDTVRYADDPVSLATALSAAPLDPGAGRALAQSLTWDRAARAHLQLYRNISETTGHQHVTKVER
ncbi:MAG: MSMEG_0565 family glycosyltransferase, partial [Frankiales bacterium]|nr:MSMEG_0565 family glycosyltransferase [Frankiales bacterium]